MSYNVSAILGNHNSNLGEFTLGTFPITTFLQTLDAAMSTFAGAVTKQTNKLLAASMSTFAGALLKQISKLLAASMSTFAGVVTKQTNKLLTASMSTFAGLLTSGHIFGMVFNAAMSTFAGILNKLTRKTITASMSTFSGVLTMGGEVIPDAHIVFTSSINSKTITGLVTGLDPNFDTTTLRLDIFDANGNMFVGTTDLNPDFTFSFKLP